MCTFLAAKKLPCNHIFHTSCLRSWFQRHQTCPTCRLDILRPTPASQPSAPVATPPPAPAPPTAEVPTPSSSNSNNDANGQGQAGNVNNPYFNSIPPQFRPIVFPQPSSDENNSNTNDTSTNSDPLSNESWNDFMSMPGPSFFSKQNLSHTNIVEIKRKTFDFNIISTIIIQVHSRAAWISIIRHHFLLISHLSVVSTFK